MSRSKSTRSALAIAPGVLYFAKSCFEARSVISSRVRCERIVEMRTENGSSVSATIFARAVSPSCRSPAGRYRRDRSRMRKPIRLRADAEVVKGFPCRVDRACDKDDIVGTGPGEGRIDRVADGGNGDRVRVRAERGRDLLRIVRPMGFRSTRVHTRGNRTEGRSDPGQVFVVQDPRNQERLSIGERLRHRSCERLRGGAVVGPRDQNERGRPDAFKPCTATDRRGARSDRLLGDRETPAGHLREGGDREAQVFDLERTEQRRSEFQGSERPANPDALSTKVA